MAAKMNDDYKKARVTDIINDHYNFLPYSN